MLKRILVVAIAFAMMSGTAQAHGKSYYDGYDTPGPLDLHSVSFGDGHGTDNWSKPVRIWLCVYTQRKWGSWELRKRAAIAFHLDVRGDGSSEYYAHFAYRNGQIEGKLFNARTHTKRWIPAYRFGNQHGACVYFTKKSVAPIRKYVDFNVWTWYESNRMCYKGCSDGTRGFRHYM